MSPMGLESRPEVKIVDGSDLQPATNEAVVSKKLAARYTNMKVGDTLKTGSFRWIIVGLFDAQGSAYESEIWTDASDLQQQTKRNIYSSVFVRLPDSESRQSLHRGDQGRSAPEARGQDRAQVLRRADDHGRSDQGARLHRRLLHRDRSRLRRDEHDVRAGLRPNPRDRNACGRSGSPAVRSWSRS